MKPIEGYILVEPIDIEENTASGLIVQTRGERHDKGTVISLGSGAFTKDGDKIPWNVKEGDTVLFRSVAPERIELDGTDYLLMREEDILAILE